MELLVLQHNRMRELLDDLLSTAGQDRRESFEEFVRWLAVHEATEAELMRAELRQDAVTSR
ncbi:hypothetical protein OG203_07490 [Nocardia sp. NBC_01499]|uniref:hemerythrin domain-containing protein n=1 Tax=Nocardia sp. NBC_01499 TaxID=2903597 RepID=UPI00386F237A